MLERYVCDFGTGDAKLNLIAFSITAKLRNRCFRRFSFQHSEPACRNIVGILHSRKSNIVSDYAPRWSETFNDEHVGPKLPFQPGTSWPLQSKFPDNAIQSQPAPRPPFKKGGRGAMASRRTPSLPCCPQGGGWATHAGHTPLSCASPGALVATSLGVRPNG
eukprot:COSAG02_NODE_3611_length_6484_cov_172.449178_6_plen_162_part_00